MSRRTSGMFASLVLVVSGLAVLGTSAPAAVAVDPTVPSCVSNPAPCLVSLKRDGTDVDPTAYRVIWTEANQASGFYIWQIEKFDSGWQTAMGSAEDSHVFSATFDFGTLFNPRTVLATAMPAKSSPVVWPVGSSDYQITVNALPIDVLHGCDTSGPTVSCPSPAPPGSEIDGYLTGTFNNVNWVSDEDARNRLAGFYNFRNAQVAEGPPTMTTDPTTGLPVMVFSLENSHESSTHVVFTGFQYLRLSDKTMNEVYGVPDPDTMTAGSIVTTISGGVGTVTIHPESDHAAILIDITGVTFSAHTVRVKLGTIVPTAPSHLTHRRLSPTRIRIRFAASKPRGARPTGYQTRCVWHRSVKIVRTKSGVVTVTHLRAGKRYSCRARASSKAGYGPWSSTVRA